MKNSYIDILNRRLGEALGFVGGGSRPRFCWKFAPDELMFFYGPAGELIRRRWAEAPAPSGQPVGAAWLLAGWREMPEVDHHGFGQGLRFAAVRAAGYSPFFETICPQWELPSEKLNANYIWALRKQLDTSFEEYMMEERYMSDSEERRNKAAWLEKAQHGYDDWTGAFGNCEPGARGGYLSLPSTAADLRGFEGI